MLSSALLAMHERVGASSRLTDVLACKRAFEVRTGAFGPEDAWFEARSAAFLDDALSLQGMARVIEEELAPEHRAYVTPLLRAHRGLFRVQREGKKFLLSDAWSSVEFQIEPEDAGVVDALKSASGCFVDGRVVAAMNAGHAEIALMPGAVFHSEDATSSIEALLPLARDRGLTTTATLDALMRMDHALRSLSRVKPAFAYRAEALPRT